MGYSNWQHTIYWHRTVGSVSTPGVGRGEGVNKEGAEYKCEETVVTSAVDWYDLECIAEDATWGCCV